MKKSICSLTLCAICGIAVAGGPTSTGPDVNVCRLYNLSQFAKDGSLNGFSVATTSYNAGDENLNWYASPQEEHPFITYNLFRMNSQRIEQIGVSWIKHGFLATNTGECEAYNGCFGGFGSELQPDCSDTYGAGLNASLTYLGPRYEVNPWSGSWSYEDSLFDNGVGNGLESSVDRLMVVHDDDLNPALNPGMTYYVEGYYVAADDVDHMNSASYRAVGTPNFSGGQWNMSSSISVSPTIGFVFQEWGGNESIVSPTGTDPVELVDNDGRCILTCKVFDNGDGTWDYEYALYNVDLDAQVDGFEVPLPSGVTVTNVGFHGAPKTEDMNATDANRGVVIDNAPWTSTVSADKVSWTTTTNPITWGTLYNFRFTADTAPADGVISVSPFRGSGGTMTTMNRVPMPVAGTTCAGDFNDDGVVDLTDFGTFGSAFGSAIGDANYNPAADFNDDGVVDLTDFGTFGSEFGSTDC